MNWVYENEVVDSLPKEIFGFVYMIHLNDGRLYIGKKQTWSKATLPALKNGQQRPNTDRIYKMKKMSYGELVNRTPAQKRANTKTKKVGFDVTWKENKWRDYTGSSKLLDKNDIKKKEILYYAFDKRELTYLEVRTLFDYRVLESDLYLNENILSRFYSYL